ncbi:helix-turn-helix domain-containing protein [Actinacidiphila guanduensis]|uniref:XRE family transcriptional regulator n=1 Tax=Actinacidiphila guanduensis TaxID=310781 RepID=A0A1H0HTA5_9ACTN|nr:helix-turn-helix transcriptional regulator [Actinacidiphila guanduensis]SDO22021.1 hypothetical protein SAMN05216259_108178 [Actinacidiphila guanduensis]
MEANRHLAEALGKAGLTQGELADVVNDHLRSLGREGTVTDRTVRQWLTGKTRWPHTRQREALERLFGCTAEELGFVRPPSRRDPTRTEDPVLRRNFLAAAGTAAASVPLGGSRPFTVGTTDVIRLRNGLDRLTALDNTKGGHEDLERAALRGAAKALELQQHGASQRIRRRLFSVAANYTAMAAQSTMDARALERTGVHLREALYLAGMAKDPIAQFRVWNLQAMLAGHLNEPPAAVDAALAAQATAVTRQDPLFASLAHARTAISHARAGNRQGALRSLGYAEAALAKAPEDEPRPSWMAFYGHGELLALTAIAHDSIALPASAEAASHRALAAIPEGFRRNRGLATARLALAQLHQGDVEQACSTAVHVFAVMDDEPLPGRMRSLLGDFHRDLITTAPNTPAAREWTDLYRNHWSQA